MSAGLISAEYLALLREMHTNPERQRWGIGGYKFADDVARLADQIKAKTVLDYGCGSGTLRDEPAMDRFEFAEYDPGIPGKDELPSSADLVVCSDVLEHIEPECLNAVLGHIAAVTKKACFFVIATRPASNYLPDGRNAHLIIKNSQWWLNRFKKRKVWQIHLRDIDERELSLIAMKRS